MQHLLGQEYQGTVLAIRLYITTIQDAEQLQDDLCKICEWTNKWQLKLNVDKCVVPRFQSPIPFMSQLSIPTLQQQQQSSHRRFYRGGLEGGIGPRPQGISF